MHQLIAFTLQPVARPLTSAIGHWAALSQQQACRNAMVAATALTADRRERDEVQEFIDTLHARRSRRAGAASPALPAARLG